VDINASEKHITFAFSAEVNYNGDVNPSYRKKEANANGEQRNKGKNTGE
jgi:hypothetical protein